jgi:hypothetical protein
VEAAKAVNETHLNATREIKPVAVKLEASIPPIKHLTVTEASPNRIVLEWPDHDDVKDYKVYWSPLSGEIDDPLQLLAIST